MRKNLNGGFNFSSLFEKLMGRGCVSEKKWGLWLECWEGKMKETIYWKRNRKQGRVKNETGGLNEGV